MASEPRWSFLGFDLRDGMALTWPPNIPVRETAERGVHVYRIQPNERRPVPRCLCGGLKGQHGTDRRGRPTCFHSAVCACTEYREKAS
jgi:hypothetical protein